MKYQKLKRNLYTACVVANLFLIPSPVLWAEQSYAQSTRLSLELSNATISDVFASVEKNSEYRFFYSDAVRAELYRNVDQPVVHCAAVIYDGIVNVPAGERCKSSHIRLILQRRSADSLATNGVKVIIGQERTVRNGNARADDPVDQVQILQHQGVLIISHVEHLLYATQLFLASTSLQRRISSRHRYSLHMPM